MFLNKLQKYDQKGSFWKILQKNPNLGFDKQSDLMRNILYTVIPIDHEIKLGIFPDDQGFDKRFVILWDNFEDLIRFSEDEFKIISVTIPPEVKYTDLRRSVGSAYTLPLIKNTWKIEVIKSLPLYIQ